jgi:malic enzyme
VLVHLVDHVNEASPGTHAYDALVCQASIINHGTFFTPMTSDLSTAEQALRDAAREYHRSPTHGKVAVTPSKPLSNQRDLSLAYSPGVAYPCLDIQADPALAAEYTSRGNLVGVVTNGTAVLGLGDIGPLAGKPVMEGKGCLFKKFAGIDVFDIELAERDPDKLVEIIAALEPTLGGINLEDIKAPECFYIERELSKRMNIPVFHDDQHGTAIISAAALLNALELVGKDFATVKMAVSGAGAAALACVDVMIDLGMRREHVFMVDSKGVIYEGRPGGFDASKARYAQRTEARTLADVVEGADVFLGCSAPGVLTVEMVKTMADRPIILALANPEPEIRPELAKVARPDCIIATGRSDYPNQVNNVLCFPYIFRGIAASPPAPPVACVVDVGDPRLPPAARPCGRRSSARARSGDGSRPVGCLFRKTPLARSLPDSGAGRLRDLDGHRLADVLDPGSGDDGTDNRRLLSARPDAAGAAEEPQRAADVAAARGDRLPPAGAGLSPHGAAALAGIMHQGCQAWIKPLI